MSGQLPVELIRFVRSYLPSVWALELMLTLSKDASREWTVEELVRNMRASRPLIQALLARFEQAGLVVPVEPAGWRWRPVSPELDERSAQVAEIYGRTPFAVIKVIAETPTSSIQDFADAFRLRGDGEKK